MSRHCFACGTRRTGAYCPDCGTDQSPANQRHFAVLRDYRDAARAVVRKSKRDRDIYGDIFAEVPPLTAMVREAAEAAADPEQCPRWLTVSYHDPDGLLDADRVFERALARLEREEAATA